MALWIVCPSSCIILGVVIRMDSLVWATFQVAASARCVLSHACYGCRSDRNSLKSASTPPTSVSILSVAFRLFASTDGAAQCRVACATALHPGAGSLWRVCRALALLEPQVAPPCQAGLPGLGLCSDFGSRWHAPGLRGGGPVSCSPPRDFGSQWLWCEERELASGHVLCSGHRLGVK